MNVNIDASVLQWWRRRSTSYSLWRRLGEEWSVSVKRRCVQLATLPATDEHGACKMALNPKAEGKKDSECTETNEHVRQSGDSKRNSLSAATSTTSNQNGDQTGCEEGAMPQQEASDRRKSGLSDARSTSNSPLPGQRHAEELPRRHFQIPRKIKERKGCALSLLYPTEAALFYNFAAVCS